MLGRAVESNMRFLARDAFDTRGDAWKNNGGIVLLGGNEGKTRGKASPSTSSKRPKVTLGSEDSPDYYDYEDGCDEDGRANRRRPGGLVAE